MSALLDVASTRSLEEAWRDVTRAKKRLPSFLRLGLDEQSMETFERRRDQNLLELGRRLRNGGFKFSQLEPVFIPKPNGKERLICVPIIADRVVQRALLNFVNSRSAWMANGVSYGFVPELSAVDAVKRASDLREKNRWAVKTDITSFFDCIDRTRLRELLLKRVRHRSLHGLLDAALSCEIARANEGQEKKLHKVGVHRGRGVRQGMPLSPYFANVMLEPFDKACLKRRYDTVRYADDLLFLASSEREAQEILDFCASELGKLNLGIPDLGDGSKTQIAAPDEAVGFLGMELAPKNGQYELRASPAQFNKIKESLYTLGSIDELRRRKLDVARFGNALESKVRAYEAAYEQCANLPDLSEHLEACRKHVVQTLMKSLGVQVSTLSESGQWFLGLLPNPSRLGHSAN